MSRRESFYEETLTATLCAVRAKRRRNALARGAALVAAVLGVGAFLIRAGGDGPELVMQPPPEVPAEKVISVFDSATAKGSIAVFSTAERPSAVRRVDDVELAELLAGRTHARFTMADGRRRLWVPES